MKKISPKAGKGLSLVEVLIGLAALTVVFAVANPMFRDASARSDVKEATLQVALALHQAKNSARDSHTAVTVLFSTQGSGNVISFEFPEADGRSLPSMPDVILPSTVSITTDTPILTFSPQGKVNLNSAIRLESAADTDFYATVMLNNLVNRVKTAYALQDTKSEKAAS